MASELIDMASQFKGLPMADLIGSPLQAACDAQLKLAAATANFIQTVGFTPNADPTKPSDIRVVNFSFDRQILKPDADPTKPPVNGTERVDMKVPLLAVVNIPALAITKVDVTFDMEVKSSSMSKDSEDKSGKFSADASVGWGVFSLKVHVEGSVATHKENTRSSDNSAKYHVEVHAEDRGMPEGLARVLDIMTRAITAPPGK